MRACNGITGFIGIGEGVQKTLERSLEKFHKGFFYRILSRATQDGVFQYVRKTGGIHRWCAKCDTKYLVFVPIFERKDLSSGLLVNVKVGMSVQFSDALFSDQFK
jgi:hypothetical protein